MAEIPAGSRYVAMGSSIATRLAATTRAASGEPGAPGAPGGPA
jgi:hypothetical protein